VKRLVTCVERSRGATQAAAEEETNFIRLLFKPGTLPQQIADAIQEVREKVLDANIST
jgi:hypothetical protein